MNSVKFGYFVSIHTYISHKQGSKPFFSPMGSCANKNLEIQKELYYDKVPIDNVYFILAIAETQ